MLTISFICFRFALSGDFTGLVYGGSGIFIMDTVSLAVVYILLCKLYYTKKIGSPDMENHCVTDCGLGYTQTYSNAIVMHIMSL